MSSQDSTTNNWVRYCAGLPEIGTRPLRPREIDDTRQLFARARWVLAGLATLPCAAAWVSWQVASQLDAAVMTEVGGSLGLGVAFVALVGVVCALLGGDRLWRWGGVVGVLAVAALGLIPHALPDALPAHPAVIATVAVHMLAVGGSFLVVRGIEAIRVVARRRRLLADLGQGTVTRCEGRLSTLRYSTALRRLARRGDIDDHGGVHGIEVLPRSGFVVSVDGQRPSRTTIAFTTQVASPAPFAFRTSLPDGLDAPTPDLKRRSLTPAEADELSRHAAALRRPSRLALVVAPLTVAAATWHVLMGGADRPLATAACMGLYALATLALFHELRRIRAGRKLRADLELRWLVTVEPAQESQAPKLEVLAISQLAWSENATPAGWRVDEV